MTNSITRGLEIRRADVFRIDDVQAKVSSVTGKVVIGPGPGEAIFQIPFPVHFIEEPNFSFGPELYPNQGLIQGSFPTATAMVVEWETVEPDGIARGRKFWTGVTIAAVTTGLSQQLIYMHCRFEGVALRNPIDRSQLSADDSI